MLQNAEQAKNFAIQLCGSLRALPFIDNAPPLNRNRKSRDVMNAVST